MGRSWTDDVATRLEHESLTEVLQALADTRELTALLGVLARLQRRLTLGFEEEESAGGFFESIVRRAPHHSAKVRQLTAEHSELMGKLARLRDKIQSCLEGPVAGVLADAQQLRLQLERHEADEVELLHDALYTDLGGRG